MSAEQWRWEYLCVELRDMKKRLEETLTQLEEAKNAVAIFEAQRDKYTAIIEMLEIAYKVRATPKDTSCQRSGVTEPLVISSASTVKQTPIQDISKQGEKTEC